jgi:methionyl-tRNA formyltransferase
MSLQAGECSIEGKKWLVGCGDDSALELIEVQLAGKRRISAEAFLNGYKLMAGERLGVGR